MPTEADIEKILEKIRPALMKHGGDIKLVDIDGEKGLVKVKMLGACHSCPFANVTITTNVQAAICQAYPEVLKVISVSNL